ERLMSDWMVSYRPSIVLRLNVDADTALKRKPDHNPALLAAKIAATSSLQFGGATIVDIDARRDYSAVRTVALATIAPIVNPIGPLRNLQTRSSTATALPPSF